jgi:tetratricopeptide (TPR) repeat protein
MESAIVDPPSKTCESLVNSSLDLLHTGDLDAAWQAAEEGIQKSGGERALTAYWTFRFVRAEVLRIRGRTQEALSFLQSLGSPRQQDIEFRAALAMHRGYCSALLGHYGAADGLLTEADALAASGGCLELQGELTARRAMIAYLQKDYYTSERLYKSVFDTYGEQFGWYLHCIARGGVGKSLMARREFQEALPWLEGAVTTAKAVGAKLLVAGFSGEAAICYMGLGDPDRALKIHMEADKVLAALGARHAYQVNLADMGTIFLQKGEFLTAISHYQRALAIAREINDPVSIEKWSFNLRLSYAKLSRSMNPELDSEGGTIGQFPRPH